MSYDLKALQNKELEILKYITDVCDQLSIQYFLNYGTLLGAVRHKGFIPWDDDIDICMTRENYDRFLEEAPQHLPTHLMVQHFTTEKEYNNLYIKVRDKNTLFLENDNKDLNICHGVFVDIFPMDRIVGGEKGALKEQNRRIRFDMIISSYSRSLIDSIINPQKRFLALVFHSTFCRIVPKHMLMRMEEKRRKRNHRRGADCFLHGWSAYRGYGCYSELMEASFFCKYEFEGEFFWGPKDYDHFLSAVYGDYMKLPPVEARITHKPLEIKL